MALTLKHVDVTEHQCSIGQALRQFWLDGQLCDMVVKSSDGTTHAAHTNVLCAASKFFQNLVSGSFAEADQVRKGEPVEIAASEQVVRALLDYIYGGQPQLTLDHSIELLRLADAYVMPKLTKAIDAILGTSLNNAPVATALKLLKQTLPSSLRGLKIACEDKVAQAFQKCIVEPDFLELSAFQLSCILRREDLRVSREDVVFEAVFRWRKNCKDGGATLGFLLRDVDFPSISSKNLLRIGQLASSMGPHWDHLQTEVDEALRLQKKRGLAENPDEFRPKRRCLKHFSAYLGASSEVSGHEVLPRPYHSLCWHEDAFYCVNCSDRIFRWKPGQADLQVVAGRGAEVTGFNDLRHVRSVCVLPDGTIIAADSTGKRLVSFRNGFGQVLVNGIEHVQQVCCSPYGAVYVLSDGGKVLSKLVGTTLQTVIDSKNLSANAKFKASRMFATSEEVYLTDDTCKGRILRISPGETIPVIVAEIDMPGALPPSLGELFVAEDGTIYLAAFRPGRVLAFCLGDTSFSEVLSCPDQMQPLGLVVHGQSLYMTFLKRPPSISGGVYEYVLPPKLQLE